MRQVLEVFPALDLWEGHLAHLEQGDVSRPHRYDQDPAAFARERASEGYRGLHVVDLTGAAQGRFTAAEVVAAIRSAAPGLFLQVAGGIRRREDAWAARQAGADRVVVGTAAWSSPAMVDRLLEDMGPEGVAVAVDSDGQYVRTHAWRAKAPVSPVDLGRQLLKRGVRHVLHTDVARDGTLAGVRVEVVAQLASLGLRVAAAGGIASTKDLLALAQAGARVAMVGRAFHAGSWKPPARVEREVEKP
jgi:phosphoribosylformimino-5-aminoimidazole carboxamide ribotide isomerase